jgi:anti-sigma B factor antagonist
MSAPNPPKFTVSTVGPTTVVKLAGPRISDQLYITELGDDLVKVFEQAQPHDLLIDLNDVEFLSSMVLGKLIGLLNRARRAKGRLRLCSIRPSILDIFEITQLNKVFEIYPDANEAFGRRG